ncbi:Uncharacterised protein [Mesomycoplasma conjunctivae]|uniref:hypothetical protein n=1 Tax=Mesomycoplasma conjunctivae TaxID=45361 RepID=UPI00059F336C|nr:hypothetical protein [Mesomycoplasma conjunctivae]VEU65775.1 Uncharacterised protein [Mesomycoplasma conjunctivae]
MSKINSIRNWLIINFIFLIINFIVAIIDIALVYNGFIILTSFVGFLPSIIKVIIFIIMFAISIYLTIKLSKLNKSKQSFTIVFILSIISTILFLIGILVSWLPIVGDYIIITIFVLTTLTYIYSIYKIQKHKITR